jgi:hypothetical protein
MYARMSTEQSLDQYYTAAQARQVLGLTEHAFQYRVKSGQIKKTILPGRKQGSYLKDEIHRIAEREASGRRKYRRARPIPVVLDWLSPDDIPAILRLDKIVYDEMYLAEMERYQQWSIKNGQLAMAAFDAKSNRETMLAYIACLPLEESVILQIMRHEREEIDITQDEIQSYERPGPYTLLANSAVVHPDHPYLLLRVLQRMIESWIERFPKQYVTKIYAQSVSERGDLLISDFYMQPRYDLADDAYMIDLARPARAKMLRRFQEALQAKDPQAFKQIYRKGEY